MMYLHNFKKTEIGLIPEDWEVKRIKDVCKLVRKSFNPNENDVRPYIGLEHIAEGILKLNGIGSSSDVKSGKLVFNKGQILFGKLRPYFRKVYRPNFDGVCSTDIFVIDKKDNNDNGFLFYFFANPFIIDIATQSSEGTRMPRASWNYLSDLEFSFPNLNEQKAISSFLSALDQKIELNYEMNRTLEEIAKTIFRHWFVHFEFPDEIGQPYKSSGGEMVDSELGEIPVCWEIGTLADICELNLNSWTQKTIPKEIHYVDIANTKNGIISELQIFDAKEAPSRARRILSPGDTIFGTVRPGNRSFTLIGDQKHLTGSTGFAVLTPNDPKLREIVYLITTSEENINRLTHLADGAAYPAVRPNVVTDEICLLPTENVIKSFHNVIGPLFDLIISNRDENVNLSKIRDSLLPKLMTGKIRVVS